MRGGGSGGASEWASASGFGVFRRPAETGAGCDVFGASCVLVFGLVWGLFVWVDVGLGCGLYRGLVGVPVCGPVDC